MAKKANPTPSISRTMAAQERRWQAESGLRTLTEAARVQSDKRLMGDVQKLAREQAAQLAKVAGRAKRK